MVIALILCLMIFGVAAPAQAQTDNTWAAWQFLLGTWTAEGGGQPGPATGTFTFHLDHDGKLLVRENRADYPAINDRPAFSHRDLMVIFPEPDRPRLRAVYTDNEAHIIHYTATAAEDHRTWTFLSDSEPSSPTYRLTYSKRDEDTLAVKLEIAPADKPGQFATYLEGIAQRKASR